MPFTTKQEKINFFRTSVRLQAPETETDPAYRFTDDDLWDILCLVAPIYSPGESIDTIPPEEFYFPAMLARKELYYRLATATAPLYPLSAEGAKLEKNVRFDHYMLLIRQTDREYRTGLDQFASGDGKIRSYEATILKNYHHIRNYNRSSAQIVQMSVEPGTEFVKCSWTKFDESKGAMFLCYKLFVTEEPVIDEFAENILDQKAVPALHATDIHRLKWKVSGLKPDTAYIATILSCDANSRFGYIEVSFRTLQKGASEDGTDAAV